MTTTLNPDEIRLLRSCAFAAACEVFAILGDAAQPWVLEDAIANEAIGAFAVEVRYWGAIRSKQHRPTLANYESTVRRAAAFYATTAMHADLLESPRPDQLRAWRDLASILLRSLDPAQPHTTLKNIAHACSRSILHAVGDTDTRCESLYTLLRGDQP